MSELREPVDGDLVWVPMGADENYKSVFVYTNEKWQRVFDSVRSKNGINSWVFMNSFSGHKYLGNINHFLLKLDIVENFRAGNWASVKDVFLPGERPK